MAKMIFNGSKVVLTSESVLIPATLAMAESSGTPSANITFQIKSLLASASVGALELYNDAGAIVGVPFYFQARNGIIDYKIVLTGHDTGI